MDGNIPVLMVEGEGLAEAWERSLVALHQGGCDIVTEMTLSGELDQLFETKGVTFDKAAAEKIREANA